MANFLKLPRAAQRAAFAHMGDEGHGRISGTLTADKPHGHGRITGKLPDSGRGGFKGTLPAQRPAKSLGSGDRHAKLATKADTQPAGQREIDDLRKAFEAGHTPGKVLSGGASADKVEKMKLSNGQIAIRKEQTPRDTRAEYLSGRVANALGIKGVTVAQTGDRETVASFVEGEPGIEAMKRAMLKQHSVTGRATAVEDETKRQAKLTNGREIGMLDWLIHNDDRHELNWMVSPDGKSVVPIDHGSAEFEARVFPKTGHQKVPRSPFVEEWIRPKRDQFEDLDGVDPQWSRAELTKIRSSIDGLKSEFSSPDEKKWHDFMLSQLDLLLGAK